MKMDKPYLVEVCEGEEWTTVENIGPLESSGPFETLDDAFERAGMWLDETITCFDMYGDDDYGDTVELIRANVRVRDTRTGEVFAPPVSD